MNFPCTFQIIVNKKWQMGFLSGLYEGPPPIGFAGVTRPVHKGKTASDVCTRGVAALA